MSQQQTNNTDEQEIDFSKIGAKFKGTFSRVGNAFFDSLFFIKRNIIVIALLFILGAGLGWYLDKKNKNYDNQLIVMPNFGSTDYLYSKVELISSKLKEGDTAFVKSIGITNPKKLLSITITPVNNVYDFVNQRATNFELLKLMAEDGNITKVIEDDVTGKNYSYHNIIFKTEGRTTPQGTLDPILRFLNNSPYYDTLKKAQATNLAIKLRLNDSVIKQIDGIVNEFSQSTGTTGSKSSNLVYYNENTQLSEIFKRKDELINEQAGLRVARINQDKIIKETSTTLNVLNKGGFNGKYKFLFPVLFVGLFILGGLFARFIIRGLRTRNN